jgi:hypothetical protein
MIKIDYSRMCFVAMPYGPRRVGRRTINFDAIYQEIFRNAVKRVKSNGLSFLPKRADDSLNSRILVHEMLTALIRSRLMLADVSVDNTNVGAELAIRYAWGVSSGTVLVRLRGTKVPFDFAQVQVTDYPHVIPDAQARIARALRETLKFGAPDNPFLEPPNLAGAIGPPGNPTELGNLLIDAEIAVRNGDLRAAIDKYRKAERIHPELAALPRRCATLFVQGGLVGEAQREMRKAFKIQHKFPVVRLKNDIVPKRSKLDRSYFEAFVTTEVKEQRPPTQIIKHGFSSGLSKYSSLMILPEYQQMLKTWKTRKKSFSLNEAERMMTEIMKGETVEDVNVKEIDFPRGRGLGRGGRLRGGFGGNFSQR